MVKFKTLKNIILALVLVTILLFFILQYFFYEVPILMYHSVSEVCAKDSLLCVSPQSFTRHMEFLSRHRYNVISLEELIKLIVNKQRLPHKLAVITFDDGYEDNFKNAYGILKKYGFPATIFVIAGFLDKPDYLSTAQLKKMHSEGIEIGSHTLTHIYLPDVSDDQILKKEIFDSKKILEEKTGRNIKFFSYPIGGYNTRIIELVRQAGYQGACTTNRGAYQRIPDIYALRRIKMTRTADSPYVMWIKLSGLYNIFRGKGKDR